MIVITNKPITDIELPKRASISNKLPNIETILSEDYIILVEGFETEPNFLKWIKTVGYFAKGEVYYIYTKHIDIANQIRDLVRIREVEHIKICFELIQLTVYDDKTDLGGKIKKDNNIILKNIIEVGDTNYIIRNIPTIRLMAIENMEVRRELKSTYVKLESKGIECENLKEELDKQNITLNETIEGYGELKRKYDSLNRDFKRAVSYSENKYKVLNINEYETPPTIIYIKVYEEIIHFNSFFEALYKSINLKMGRTLKIVNLVTNETYATKLMSTKWDIEVASLNKQKIQTHDFILKVGDYSSMMDFLLRNEMRLDYVVVIDNLNINKNILLGKLVYFNMCRNSSNLFRYGLDLPNTIVNNNENAPLSYNTVEKYKLNEESSKLLELSNQTAVQGIIDTLKILKEN